MNGYLAMDEASADCLPSRAVSPSCLNPHREGSMLLLISPSCTSNIAPITAY